MAKNAGGQAPPYPNEPGYQNTDADFEDVTVPEGPVAKCYEPGKAKRYAEEDMMLKDVRRGSPDAPGSGGRRGKRII